MSSAEPVLEDLDRKLLNILQSEFPLAERPFAALGDRLGTSEADAMERVRRLREGKVIRQVSAIFDTRALGYASSLVAARFRPERLAEGAKVVSDHPGVSHNYERNHEFNLWYTVAVPPTSRLGLEGTVERLRLLSGAEAMRILPTLKLYKIGVKLDMTGEEDAAGSDPGYSEKNRALAPPVGATDIAVIRELQKDLRVAERPFDPYARTLRMTLPDLFAYLKKMQDLGQLRRFAAVLHHRKAGFHANAMGVWKVGEDEIDRMGERLAAFRAVSHCYRRPVYPDWPYPLFTMVHGRTVEECNEILASMSRASGLTEYRALYSTREYKKTRVPYFTPELDDWERKFA